MSDAHTSSFPASAASTSQTVLNSPHVPRILCVNTSGLSPVHGLPRVRRSVAECPSTSLCRRWCKRPFTAALTHGCAVFRSRFSRNITRIKNLNSKGTWVIVLCWSFPRRLCFLTMNCRSSCHNPYTNRVSSNLQKRCVHPPKPAVGGLTSPRLHMCWRLFRLCRMSALQSSCPYRPATPRSPVRSCSHHSHCHNWTL